MRLIEANHKLPQWSRHKPQKYVAFGDKFAFEMCQSVRIGWFFLAIFFEGKWDCPLRAINWQVIRDMMEEYGTPFDRAKWFAVRCASERKNPYVDGYWEKIRREHFEKKLRQKHDSRVYFMRNNDNGEIKIGVSIQLKQRLWQLRGLLRADLEIIATIKGSYELEEYLHNSFSKYRLHGEWFEPSWELRSWIARYATPYVK